MVTSSSGSPHGMKLVSSSYCIPVRNESRPVMMDAFFSGMRVSRGRGKRGTRRGRRKGGEIWYFSYFGL